MLNQEIISLLNIAYGNIESNWWVQDGAPAHKRRKQEWRSSRKKKIVKTE